MVSGVEAAKRVTCSTPSSKVTRATVPLLLTWCAGKVFKVVDDRSSTPPRVEAFASFGGLLMLLKGEVTALKDLEVDMRLYILIRRI